MILICHIDGTTLFEGETITICSHYEEQELRDFIEYIKIKTKYESSSKEKREKS